MRKTEAVARASIWIASALALSVSVHAERRQSPGPEPMCVGVLGLDQPQTLNCHVPRRDDTWEVVEACKLIKDCEALRQKWRDEGPEAAADQMTRPEELREPAPANGTKVWSTCDPVEHLNGRMYAYCTDLDVHAYIAVINKLGSWQFKLAPGETAPPSSVWTHAMEISEKEALELLCYFYFLEEAGRNASERVIFLRARSDFPIPCEGDSATASNSNNGGITTYAKSDSLDCERCPHAQRVRVY